MIGNDIIDLQLAAVQSDWQRPGFREKIFTEGENYCINQSQEPSSIVWRIWSMKESGYKAYMRLHPKRFFNPKKMNCTIAENGSGQVDVAGYIFYTESIIEDDWIFTTAVHTPKKKLIEECFFIPADKHESSYCHEKLKQGYAQHWSVSSSQLAIDKSDEGVPRLTCASKDLSVAVSIAHHGRYGCYSIEK